VGSRKVRTRIKIDDQISKKGSHILAHKHLFSMMVLELFWKAGHHPQQEHQSSPPEICVKKLQRDTQKGVLQ
jgi:hypothetical protein